MTLTLKAAQRAAFAIFGEGRFIRNDMPCLYHYGVAGMKWGVRRYQNEDGTLTSAGKKRYAKSGGFSSFRSNVSSSVKKGFNKIRYRYKNPDGSLTERGVEQYASKKKNTSKLSDSDLRKVVNRATLNKQYREVMRDLSSKDKSFISSIVDKISTATISEATNSIGRRIGGHIANAVIKDPNQKEKKEEKDDD